jgi:hypothetical protein
MKHTWQQVRTATLFSYHVSPCGRRVLITDCWKMTAWSLDGLLCHKLHTKYYRNLAYFILVSCGNICTELSNGAVITHKFCCYVVLCYVMLCCVVLCCVVLCCVVIWYIMLGCVVMLCYVIYVMLVIKGHKRSYEVDRIGRNMCAIKCVHTVYTDRDCVEH